MKLTNKLLRYHRWGFKTDILWLGVILAGLSFFTSVMPLPANDFWWHLKIGEIIYQTKNIPTTNIFGWSIPAETPFVYGAWLGEYAFYCLYHWGALALVTFSRNFLFTMTIALMAYEAYRRTHSWRLSAFITLITYLMVMNNLAIRPQNWSWICFVAFLTLLNHVVDGQIDRRWLLLLPLVMMFWVNAHGAFVLGIVLTGAFCVGEGLRRLFNLPEALPWSAIRWLAIICGLTILATIVNPQGIDIFQYVINLMTDQPSQGLIVEWQSPSPAGISNIVFFGTILLLMVLPWFTKHRLRPTDMLLVIGFTWLAWGGIRYIVWYALAVMPILAQILASFIPNKWLRSTTPRNLLNVILLCLIFLPVIAVQPWFFEKINWPFPEKYWQLLQTDTSEGLFLANDTPVQAANYLKSVPPRPIFNAMGYGSYLIWAMPEQGVFIDPRVELYAYEQWQDYIKISNAARYNLLLEKYGVERLVLNIERQADLIEALKDDPLWTQVYADAHTQIWDKQ